jgi:hypothetical protein
VLISVVGLIVSLTVDLLARMLLHSSIVHVMPMYAVFVLFRKSSLQGLLFVCAAALDCHLNGNFVAVLFSYSLLYAFVKIVGRFVPRGLVFGLLCYAIFYGTWYFVCAVKTRLLCLF